jgi:zinc transport system ATP-binding protein
MGPKINVTNLGLSLGNSEILNGINMQVDPGEVHCIVGPNGGGKTSTLRCILGQMPHTGNIEFEWGDSRTIGYVPQFLDFDKTLPVTVKNFMSMVCQQTPAFFGLRKKYQKAVEDALASVHLKDKEKAMIGNLSGGERQRLLFAQALIPEPSLIVLDEPMTSLDEAGISIFEGLINDLTSKGKTLLWVNHDMAQVKRLANKLTVIDGGVIASGPVDEVLTEPMMHGNFRGVGEETPSNTKSSLDAEGVIA